MPSPAPYTSEQLRARLRRLGEQIKARRKSLRVNATITAESAGLSRVTLHRIENGEPSVTLGAYSNVLAALGLEFSAIPTTPVVASSRQAAERTANEQLSSIPLEIKLSEYPQLSQLAWHVQGVPTLTPIEAWGIYERNWRHIDEGALTPSERALIHALERAIGGPIHV